MSPKIDLQVMQPRNLARVTARGALTASTIQRMFRGLSRLAPDGGLDFLIDLRQSEHQLAFSEVYELVITLERYAGALQGRIALLDYYRPQFEMVQFFEAAATRKGFNVRTFLSFEEATNWILAAPQWEKQVPRTRPRVN